MNQPALFALTCIAFSMLSAGSAVRGQSMVGSSRRFRRRLARGSTCTSRAPTPSTRITPSFDRNWNCSGRCSSSQPSTTGKPTVSVRCQTASRETRPKVRFGPRGSIVISSITDITSPPRPRVPRAGDVISGRRCRPRLARRRRPMSLCVERAGEVAGTMFSATSARSAVVRRRDCSLGQARAEYTAPGPPRMAHEIAKLLLEQAGNFLAREEAIKSALSLGMPLRDIEEYLDWLDSIRPPLPPSPPPPLPPPSSARAAGTSLEVVRRGSTRLLGQIASFPPSASAGSTRYRSATAGG